MVLIQIFGVWSVMESLKRSRKRKSSIGFSTEQRNITMIFIYAKDAIISTGKDHITTE